MEEKAKFQVTLVQVADFSFDEASYKTVDKSVFDMLVEVKSPNPDVKDSQGVPEMYCFKDKNDYANNAWKCDIDASKPVYVSDKGRIFCFRG